MVKRDLMHNLIAIVIGLVLLMGLRLFVFSAYRITLAEANHYLHPNDLLVINRLEDPKEGDFVLYRVNGQDYLGRIVAKAGDRVTYMDDIFYKNDLPASQDYLEPQRLAYLAKSSDGAVYTSDFSVETITSGKYQQLPVETYLILNDDRQNSMDSREFGLIQKAQIKGVVSFRLLPLGNFGFVKTQ